MNEESSLPGVLRRGIVTLGILAAHVGIALLIARIAVTARTEAVAAAPLVATFVEETAHVPEPPKIPRPTLARVQPVNIAVPEIRLPVDPQSTAISVPVAPSPPRPAVPASAPARPIPAMSQVAYLKPPAPRYPPASRRAREQGLVILRVLIDKTGHVEDVDVAQSSGHPRLDDAAREAVERALFKPYVERGVACAAFAMIPIEFSLHRAS